MATDRPLTVPEILLEIATINTRLGKPDEKPEDFDRVTDLIHSLGSSFTKIQSDRVLAARTPTGDSSSPVLFADGVAA